MGSLKRVVEPECGQRNALMQLGNQVSFEPIANKVSFLHVLITSESNQVDYYVNLHKVGNRNKL